VILLHHPHPTNPTLLELVARNARCQARLPRPSNSTSLGGWFVFTYFLKMRAQEEAVGGDAELTGASSGISVNAGGFRRRSSLSLPDQTPDDLAEVSSESSGSDDHSGGSD
jgi:hypothetical protein